MVRLVDRGLNDFFLDPTPVSITFKGDNVPNIKALFIVDGRGAKRKKIKKVKRSKTFP